MSPITRFPARTLTTDALAITRGERVLFENLSFSLASGTIAELRGPNGAGKTSLLLCLAGIIPPTSGTIVIKGRDPETRPGSDIGFLPHLSAVKAHLTVRENLEFWAAINGARKSGIDPALTIVGLLPIAGLDAGTLSAGQTRRLALARLIMAERPVWLLDEPTAALDRNGEMLVTSLIHAQLERGGLVIAATHHDLDLPDPARTTTITLGANP